MKRLILLLLVVAVQAISGQTEVSAQTEPQADTSKLENIHIPIAEVPSSIEELKVAILDISRDIRIESNIQQIKDTLTGFEQLLESQMLLDSTELNQMNLNELTSAERDIMFIQKQISSWSSELLNRVTQLNGFNNQIETKFEIWGVTKSNAVDNEAPQLIIESIDNLLDELSELQDSVKSKSSEVLTMQATLTSISNELTIILSDISRARSIILANLFVPEQPTLWRIQFDSTSMSFTSHAKSAFIKTLNTVTDFNSRNPTFKYKTIAFFFFIQIIFLYVRYFNKEWRRSGIDQLQTAQLAINRPFSSTLIITWVFLIIWREAPRELFRLIELIMLAPFVLLLRGILGSKYYKWLWILLAFGVFHSLYALILAENLLQRFSLILITMLTGWVLVRLLMEKGILKNLESYTWLLRNIIRLSIFLCFIGLIANIIGSVLLSELLIIGVIVLFLGGILFYAAETMLTTIIALLITSPLAKKSNLFTKYKVEILQQTSKLLRLGGVILWLYLMLGVFTIQAKVMQGFSNFLNFNFGIGELNISIGNILAFIITIYFSILISRLIRFILEEEVFERTEMAKGVPGTIVLLVRYGVIGLGFLIAVIAAGIDLSNITIIVGALGVGIGFGLQDIFNNLISGLILAFERPVQVGDVIQVGELKGIVQNIGFRSSTVKGYDGTEVIVPNGQIVSKQILNFTLSDRRRRISLNIGVAYGSDPVRVLELLSEVAAEHKEVLEEPSPRPRFVRFGDSSLDFQLLYWIEEFEDNFRIETEINVMVSNKFKENGIRIPFPQRDIHIKSNPEGNLSTPQKPRTD